MPQRLSNQFVYYMKECLKGESPEDASIQSDNIDLLISTVSKRIYSFRGVER